MKAIGNLFSLVMGLALIAVFVIGAFLGIKYILGLYSGLDPQLEAVLTIATLVILLAAAIIANGIRAAKIYGNDNRTAKEKCKVYDQLIRVWTQALRETGKNRDTDSFYSREEANKINRDMLLLASNSVLNQFISFKSLEQEAGYEDPKVQAEIARMVLEFRRDLGRKNWNLKEKDLLDMIRDNSSPA